MAFAILAQGNAGAQVEQSSYSFPLALAVKAATTAIASCASSGYRVSAAVVDMSGTVLLQAKGDHSTIHTAGTAQLFARTLTELGFLAGRSDRAQRRREHLRWAISLRD
jgi:uncharacterized protein GlcG (DUF336 family)